MPARRLLALPQFLEWGGSARGNSGTGHEFRKGGEIRAGPRITLSRLLRAAKLGEGKRRFPFPTPSISGKTIWKGFVCAGPVENILA
jgi:hypothetical protein